ncbi:SulP family inorganic anion transporter [Cellulomonas sp. P5_E12]
MTAPQGTARRHWSDHVPLVGALRGYQRPWLRTDIAAGVAVAALIVPKNLGYAGIAGIPLQNGLYAAAAGAILYAIFGTSRQISTGPSSGLAAVAASAVLTAGVVGDQVAPFVAGITLVSGLIFLLLSVLKMGWIAQFLSRAVVTGFLFGAAIDVVIGELPKITGTSVEGSTPPQELVSWLGTLGDANRATVLVGALALITVFGLRRVAPRVPGALVLVVGGLLATWLLDLGARGVALVGDVPRGLPSVVVPDPTLLLDNAATVALASVALVMIGFSQTAGDARMFAARHRYRVDIDQESLAQGAANVGAGLLQGMPVSTSLSASSLNDRSGARSPVASLTSGVMVLLTLVLLAPLFSGLPTAVLAAIIIEAVVMGMMDVAGLRRLFRVQRFDFWIAIAALVSTLVVGVLAGVLVGIGLSLLWLVSVTTRPSLPLMAREQGTQVFRELGVYPDDLPEPGIAVIRIDGGLFFATADAVQDRVREVADAQPDARMIVIDCGAVAVVDAQGAAALHEILDLARDTGVAVRLARVKPAVRATLQRDGVVERLGAERIHGSVHRAVEAHRAQTPPDREE